MGVYTGQVQPLATIEVLLVSIYIVDIGTDLHSTTAKPSRVCFEITCPFGRSWKVPVDAAPLTATSDTDTAPSSTLSL